jgi:hypothetical protein
MVGFSLNPGIFGCPSVTIKNSYSVIRVIWYVSVVCIIIMVSLVISEIGAKIVSVRVRVRVRVSDLSWVSYWMS